MAKKIDIKGTISLTYLPKKNSASLQSTNKLLEGIAEHQGNVLGAFTDYPEMGFILSFDFFDFKELITFSFKDGSAVKQEKAFLYPRLKKISSDEFKIIGIFKSGTHKWLAIAHLFADVPATYPFYY